eukprot:TRINITY_DN11318_c0_g1_i1.p1 TRINITY_DN11318_c0_g1~~TRINITY_DN11318_c0_g1_i1.p1  ORF type:complete len:156 (-),score=14.79 TRINITY_DN11318_c0_g1_i1:312-779(-)
MNTTANPTEFSSDMKTASTPNRLKSLPSKSKQISRRPEFTLNLSLRDHSYNALKDKNLASYFANPRRRNHLVKMKLLEHTGCTTQKHILNQLGRDRNVVFAKDIDLYYLDKLLVSKRTNRRYNEIKLKRVQHNDLILPEINVSKRKRKQEHARSN